MSLEKGATVARLLRSFYISGGCLRKESYRLTKNNNREVVVKCFH